MSIGFIPGALPSIVQWAERYPDRVYEALLGVERSARDAPSQDLVALRLVRVDEAGDQVMAVSAHEDGAVIIAAALGLTQARAEQIARRLVRANWRSRLLTIDLDGLDLAELAVTLTEVLHATDLTEAPLSRYAAPSSASTSEELMDAVKSHAQPWGTRVARERFKGLMEAAAERPQKVTRPGGDPVYVVAESVLEGYAHPIGAPQLVAAFADPPSDMRMALHPRPAPRSAIVIDTVPDAAGFDET